jgi:hypothetical protein
LGEVEIHLRADAKRSFLLWRMNGKIALRVPAATAATKTLAFG